MQSRGDLLRESEIDPLLYLYLFSISTNWRVIDWGYARVSRLPQVAIMTPDMAAFQTVEEAGYSQEQDDIHPVTLLATSNGTHIAVQVGRTTP